MTRRLRVTSIVLSTLVASAIAAADWSLHRVPQTIADSWGAKCLDGSVPSYYASFVPGATMWRLHFRGGAWCFDAASCASRAASSLGSSNSTYMKDSVYEQCSGNSCEAVYGLMSNRTENPLAKWHAVLVNYCDGSSWTGDREEPITTGSRTFWLRGRRNLDAILASLDAEAGLLTNATRVIVSGTSAGGLTAILHTDYVASRAPAAAHVVSLPDAGFFLDGQDVTGAYSYRRQWQSAVGPSFWNATVRGTHAGCLAAVSPVDAWQCFFSQYVYPYVKSPTFVVQSAYDSYQMGAILHESCNLAVQGNCNPTQVAQIATYSSVLRNNVTSAVAATGARDGYFVTSCWQHEETCQWIDWAGITIGSTMQTVFIEWLNGGPVDDSRRVDGTFGSDPTCAPQGVVHGSC